MQPGMSMSISLYPKDAGLPPVTFTSSGHVSLPAPNGVANMSVTYTVPVGYDDLSASVQMFVDAGPPPPPTPPAPPGTVCACPPLPVNGSCMVSDVLHGK